jgi:hypothetical protein
VGASLGTSRRGHSITRLLDRSITRFVGSLDGSITRFVYPLGLREGDAQGREPPLRAFQSLDLLEMEEAGFLPGMPQERFAIARREVGSR